jgi:membrane-bound metal-dependent hydrolase YbcI (DUF457 family)
MTPIGHALPGASFGTISVPRETRGFRKLFHVVCFIFLGNIQDLPIPMWGHDRYDISHSIFVSLLLCLLFVFILTFWFRYINRSFVNRWILFCGCLAIVSHLLLDSFYNHGLGVPIFWPFSDKSLVLPISWLSVQKDFPPPFTLEMIRIWLLEFVTFGPFVLLSSWINKLTNT